MVYKSYKQRMEVLEDSLIGKGDLFCIALTAILGTWSM